MMQDQDSVLARLGHEVAQFGTCALEDDVWQKAKTCMLDAIGLSQIAKHELTTRAVCEIIEPKAGDDGVLVWATGARASLSEAVTANAVAVHAHFHDDSDPSSWCHPGSLIAPVAIGVTEHENGSVSLALRSLIAGYTVLNWLGADQHVAKALIKRGIRTSPALGIIGAAAAASVALQLNPQQTANALAMAASMSGGTLAPLRSGSDEWRMQNAHAARGGLLAARMAQRGINGAATALDGMKGFLQSLAGLTETPEAWSRPLRRDAILDIYAKPWSTLGDNMASVRAAKLLHDDGIDVSQIESVEVTLWRDFFDYPGTQYKGPFDLPIQALASTSFAVAAMLLLGDLEYDVSLERRADPAILDLVKRIEIVPSDEGGKLASTVTVRAKGGRVFVRHASEAPATWLYHDAETAIGIWDRRLQTAGVGTARAKTLGRELFAARVITQPVATFLAGVIGTAPVVA